MLYFGPAHTNGDILVFFPAERVAFVGDQTANVIGHAGTVAWAPCAKNTFGYTITKQRRSAIEKRLFEQPFLPALRRAFSHNRKENLMARNACLFVLFFGLLCAPPAEAQRRGGGPRPAMAPRGRSVGARAVGMHVVPQHMQPVHQVNNPPHQVVYRNARTGRTERHPIIIEHRPGHVVDRDPHLRIARRGYRPARAWGHFHPVSGGWWRLWGVAAWDTVGTVTCEAANEATGELYPVSQDRDAQGWDDPTINATLDQALDDCMQESNGAQCVPATPNCTFQRL